MNLFNTFSGLYLAKDNDLLFAFGSVGVGDAKATLIMLALVAVTFLMMWFLISKSFLQVATSTGKVSKVVYHKKTMKQESVTKALLFREFKHFTSSPGYMLNSGLGIFLMPICAVALLWKGRKIFIMLSVWLIYGSDKACAYLG